MNALKRGRVAVAVSLLVPAVALAQAAPKKPMAAKPAAHIVPASGVTYQPLEVPGFPTGLRMAAIHGDPNAASGSYVIRLAFPDGYNFPAHWHPKAENLTVLEGELLLGMGDKAEGGTTTGYKVGSFLRIPGKMAHFGGVSGATVIQLHGEAPFKIVLSAPAAK
ncbi:MAG TPA: cupin domain-containing protein [Gemmatimonadales bacterium]|jgi:quercetin dioxygenase-like cupin family protein|nr:cupin domain-containing protein [Gemmatimonadales bacterium]